MSTTADQAAVRQAIGGIADAFAADGYRLSVIEAGPEVRLGIEAVGDVCADCLIPASVLVPMVAQALADTVAAGRPIQVRYPNGSPGR